MINLKTNQEHEYCKEKEPPRFYRIGMFANMNHVTIKTLRYYDEQNLLKPVYVDEENGYRYYEASQIAELHRILALKNMGFSIEDIRRIASGEEEKNLLLRKKQEILKEMATLKWGQRWNVSDVFARNLITVLHIIWNRGRRVRIFW